MDPSRGEVKLTGNLTVKTLPCRLTSVLISHNTSLGEVTVKTQNSGPCVTLDPSSQHSAGLDNIAVTAAGQSVGKRHPSFSIDRFCDIMGSVIEGNLYFKVDHFLLLFVYWR